MQRIQVDVPPPEFLSEPEKIEQAVREFRDARYVALDTETTGLDIMNDVPLYIALATPTRRIILRDSMARCLEPLFDDPRVALVMHNAKFDMHMLANIGIRDFQAEVRDTLVMAAMSDSSRSSLKLKELSWSVYGADDPKAIRYLDFIETFGRPSKKKSVTDLLQAAAQEVIADYATCDAWTTIRLYYTLKSQLEETVTWRKNTLWDIFRDVEVPFTRLLWKMERRGTYVNAERLAQLKEDWEKKAVELEKQFSTMAGRVININSIPQLRQLFLAERKLKSSRLTKGGESGEMKPSVEAAVLKEWADQGVTEAAVVLKYREYQHLLSNFIYPLLAMRDIKGRVHTTWGQVGTETGRLNSVEPNLMNIPTRSKTGKQIRECFCTIPKRKVIVRDYEQLEMKLAAGLAGDPLMIGVINEGKDIHSGNACIAFGIVYDELMAAIKAEKDEQPLSDTQKYMLTCRKRAKTIGFGILYGEGTRKLAGQLGIKYEEAVEIKGMFFSKFAALLADIQRTHNRVRKDGRVQTLMGRMRALPAAYLNDTPAYWKALRQAYNTRVQGTAADVAKLAMLRIDADDILRDAGGELLMQVHDELICEAPDEGVDATNERMKFHMSECLADIGVKLPVTLTTSGGPGLSWGQAKK